MKLETTTRRGAPVRARGCHHRPRAILDRRWPSRCLGVLVATSLGATAKVQADWLPVTGTNAWEVQGNWLGNVIDGRFNQVSTSDQTVTFAASTSVGSLDFSYDGGFNMTLASGSTTIRSLTLTSGGITVSPVVDGRTITIGTNSGGLRVGLNGVIKDMNVGGANELVLFNSITSAGGIRKLGTGTLRLQGSASSYALGTEVVAGTLAVGDNNALGAGTVTMSGGRIASFSTGRTVANNFVINADTTFGGAGFFALTIGGTVNLGSTLRTLTAENTLTFNGIVSGTGGLTLTNGATARTVTLAAANDFTGGLTVGGTTTAALSGTGSLSSSNTVTLNNSSTSSGFSISGLTVSTTTIGALAGVSTSGVVLGANNLTVGANHTDATYAGIISGSAGGSFTKIGTGIQTLSGANTFTGGATLDGGTLALGSNSALGTGLVTLNAGRLGSVTAVRSLANNVVINGDITFGGFGSALTINGTTNLGAALRTLTAENSINFNGIVSGSGGLSVTTGTTARNINLNTANDFTGGLTVGGLASVVLGANGSIADSNTVNLTTSTAELDISAITAPSETIGALAGVALSDVTLISKNLTVGANNADADFGGTISGSAGGSFTKIGTGIQTLSGGNTYNGPTVISSGTLRLAGTGSLGVAPGAPTPGNVVINAGATLAFDRDVNFNANRGFALGPTTGPGSATIQVADIPSVDNDVIITGIVADNGGSGRLIKTGAGKLRLQDAINTFTGGISILEGTLSFGFDSRLGAVPASPTPGHLVINGGTLQATATVTINANRGIAIGPTSGTGTGTISVDSGFTLTYDSAITNNGAGIGRLVKTGGGTLRVQTTASTFSGGLSILEGTVSFAQDTRLGAVPGSATPGALLINGGTLFADTNANVTLNANRGIALGPDTGSGAGTLSSASGTTLIYGGVIANNGAGTGGLIKAGAGSLTLSGSSTYTGPTQITGGTLNLNGSISATQAVSLTSGTLLLGGAAESINDSAILSLGSGTRAGFATGVSGRVETLLSLDLLGSAILDFGAGGNNRFTFTNGITGLGANTLSIYNWTLGGSGTRDLLAVGGSLLSEAELGNIRFFADGAGASFLGTGAQIAFGTPAYELVPIPEPSSTGLLGTCGLFGLIAARHWRGRRARGRSAPEPAVRC